VDLAIGTTLERFMARRAHAKITTVKRASHVVMMAHPAVTARVIMNAAAGRR
jgi:hypothetical protein